MPHCEGEVTYGTPCPNTATTTRSDYRFGNVKKGEPVVMPITIHYCPRCAARYDDRMDEGAAEAAGS